MQIKIDDKVIIISGKDRGKMGKITQVFRSENRVVVEGANRLVKHLRPQKAGEKGQRVEFFAPMDASNVKLMCPKCNNPTRVYKKFLEDGKKVRCCKKCNERVE